MRMLMNNLDPEVAEHPDDLVVYGGTGRAARDWRSFDAMVRTLTTLADDETMLVQSGRPVGVLEAFVPFAQEISVICARGSDGLIWVAVASPVDGLVERRDRHRVAGQPAPLPGHRLRVAIAKPGGAAVRPEPAIDADPPRSFALLASGRQRAEEDG